MTERAKIRVALLRVTSNILRSSSNNWSLVAYEGSHFPGLVEEVNHKDIKVLCMTPIPSKIMKKCGNSQSKQTNAGIPLKILWKLFPPPQSWETGESTRLRRRRNIGRFLPYTCIFFRKVINSLKMVVTS